MNQKGFVLMETLVVTIFVLFVFSVLYNNVVPLLGKYNELSYYDDLDTTYDLYHLREMVQSDINYDTLTNNNYQKIGCSVLSNSNYCNYLFDYLKVDNSDELVYLKISAIDILKNDNNYSYDLRNYLNYIDTTKLGNDILLLKNGDYVSYIEIGPLIEVGCYSYRLASGGVQLVDYNVSCGGINVNIPATANGFSVVGIARYAFYNKEIISVVIPDTVKIIDDSAFYMNNLSEVTIPDSVEEIGERAFANNTNLTTVNLGTGITFIKPLAFDGDTSLVTVKNLSGRDFNWKDIFWLNCTPETGVTTDCVNGALTLKVTSS